MMDFFNGFIDGKPLSLSDADARMSIEFCCPVTVVAGVEWFDVSSTAPINTEPCTRALRWLVGRADNISGFQAIQHQHRLNLIRFKED